MPVVLDESLLKPKEADEFSFVGEHIENEPSIHIRSLHQFENIMRQPKTFVDKKKVNYFKDNQKPIKTASTEANNALYMPHNVIYETFEEDNHTT